MARLIPEKKDYSTFPANCFYCWGIMGVMKLEFDISDVPQKYIKEAEEKGLTVIGKSKEQGKLIYKRKTCGHVTEIQVSSVRHNKKTFCSQCTEDELKRCEDKYGLQFIRKVNNLKNEYFVKSCGHNIVLFKTNLMRSKGFSCQECEYEAFTKHLAKFDLEIVEFNTSDPLETKSKNKTAKLRFKGCGHITNRIRSLTKDYAPCYECRQKEKADVYSDNGMELVSRISSVKSLYRFKSCGHERVFYESAALRGNCVCTECQSNAFSEESKVYLLKVTTENEGSFLKFGYGKNLNNRIREYRAKNVSKFEVLFEKDFDRGIDALKVEKAIHKKFSNVRLDSSYTKQFLTRGGFTECYPLSSLDSFIEELEAINE